MGIWLQQTDLENAISVPTVLAIFDDAGTGVVNAAAVAATIDRGEQEVLSWLIDEYGPTLPDNSVLGQDPFLKFCALEYVVAHAFDRHPEYVRANGKERGERFTRADDRMERVLKAKQRPRVLEQTRPPADVGGGVYSGDPNNPIPPPKTFADGTSDF